MLFICGNFYTKGLSGRNNDQSMRLEIDRPMIADSHSTHPYEVIVDRRSAGGGHYQSPAWTDHAFSKLDELYLQGPHQIVEIGG
jgi:hypothetical protein